MGRISHIVFLFGVILPLTTALVADDQGAARVEAARQLVRRLAAGEYENAVGSFDKTMKKALPVASLKMVWEGVLAQQGAFKEIAATRKSEFQQYKIVFVVCEFQRGKLATKVVFNTENEVSGLFFVPEGEYKTPAYVRREAFEESEVTVGKGFLTLPGTLAVPKGERLFPAVVLVHGSGPNDRDETIGPIKPFRDLAQGLASQGIAVLRYEKRTRHYPRIMSLQLGSLTVKEETVDDAVAAVETLANTKRIDSQRIFVLGHSLGGTVLPKIAAANDRIAGFVSLAGSVRPLEDLILDQTQYILSLDGKIDAAEKAGLDEIAKQVALVKSPELSRDTPREKLPLGIPAIYWLDLREYFPDKAAKSIKGPLLFLQGERDYQVTMEDFGMWKKELASRADAKFISYPALNHLFIPGDGKSTPAEYQTPGNVAEEVVMDIARWIKGRGAM